MYNENYLIHYGKIGMRWGQRNPRTIGPIGRTLVKSAIVTNRGLAKIHQKSADNVKKDIDSITSQKNKMLSLKTKKGKPLFTKESLDSTISGLEKVRKEQQSKSNSRKEYADNLVSGLNAIKIRDLDRRLKAHGY